MRFLAALTVLTLLAACRSSAPHEGTPGSPSDVLVAQQDAWNAGDIDRFVELGYWRSPELTFFSGGTVTQGYEPLVERYHRRYKSEGNAMGTLSFTDLEEFRLGARDAMVRGHWQLDYDDRESIAGLFTLIMRRAADAWIIVHDHTSADEKDAAHAPNEAGE